MKKEKFKKVVKAEPSNLISAILLLILGFSFSLLISFGPVGKVVTFVGSLFLGVSFAFSAIKMDEYLNKRKVHWEKIK